MTLRSPNLTAVLGLLALAFSLSLTPSLIGCGTTEPVPVDVTPVHVRAFVERADVTPGKPFVLTVEVDRRQDVTFTLPDIGASARAGREPRLAPGHLQAQSTQSRHLPHPGG
jgi:hypothetical protein